MSGHSRYLGLALATALLAMGAVALASPGALTYLGCHGDDDSNPDGCPTTSKSLEGADAVAVSRDGTSVYVAGFLDEGIARFARNTTTGFLSYKSCVGLTGVNANYDSCGQTAKGLDLPNSIAISPDGKSVYVTGSGLVRFNRDTTTGALTPAGCFEDVNDQTPPGCSQAVKGLSEPQSVIVSPDGKSLYVIGRSDEAIDHFQRDTTTGGLTYKGCVAYSGVDGNPDGCGKTAKGLYYPNALALSADGKSLYVVSDGDNLTRFARDTTSGALTYKSCVGDKGNNFDSCGQTADGLGQGFSVVVSTGGTSVYVAGYADNAIARFDRDTTTGALTPQPCIGDVDTNPDACPKTASGLDGVGALAISHDGTSLYASGSADDAVVRLNRHTDTGVVSFKDCVGDRFSNPDSCTGTARGILDPDAVAVTRDGISLYVAGFDADAITRFARSP